MDDRGTTTKAYDRWAHLYDLLLGEDMAPLVMRNFHRIARRYAIPIESVADVGCGTGAFVRHLRSLGARVFGVDRSPAMIREARRKNEGNGAVFLCQDLRDLSLPNRVHLITCNFDVLNYLRTPGQLERAFHAFRRNLLPRGDLVFDVIVAGPGNVPGGSRTIEFSIPGFESRWTITVDPIHRIRRVVMRHRRGSGELETEVHTQRAFSTGRVASSLRRCSFVPRGVEPFHGVGAGCFGGRRRTFVARRIGP